MAIFEEEKEEKFKINKQTSKQTEQENLEKDSEIANAQWNYIQYWNNINHRPSNGINRTSKHMYCIEYIKYINTNI